MPNVTASVSTTFLLPTTNDAWDLWHHQHLVSSTFSFLSFFLLYLLFLGPHPRHMEVPRSNQNCSCRWCRPQPQQSKIQDTSATCTTAHSNVGSLTYWERPGIEPASSRILVGFVNHWATTGTPSPAFFHFIRSSKYRVGSFFFFLIARHLVFKTIFNNDFYLFQYSWFTVFWNFSTAQGGDIILMNLLVQTSCLYTVLFSQGRLPEVEFIGQRAWTFRI